MIIVTIRTDKEEAEIGLFDNDKRLDYTVWQAHRKLAETVHFKIVELLNSQGWTLDSLEGVVVYRGPGSFTGLRIGLSVANALAYSKNIPISASDGSNWIAAGVVALKDGKNYRIALPKYGALPNITLPKH